MNDKLQKAMKKIGATNKMYGDLSNSNQANKKSVFFVLLLETYLRCRGDVAFHSGKPHKQL